jgi:hypothetical protein
VSDCACEVARASSSTPPVNVFWRSATGPFKVSGCASQAQRCILFKVRKSYLSKISAGCSLQDTQKAPCATKPSPHEKTASLAWNWCVLDTTVLPSPALTRVPHFALCGAQIVVERSQNLGRLLFGFALYPSEAVYCPQDWAA